MLNEPLSRRAKRAEFLVAAAAGALLAFLFAACGDEPRSPTEPAPRPAQVVLSRIEISGPTTLYIGEPAQFTATAHYSDTSSRDVTTEAVWSTGLSAQLPTSAPGRYTPVGSGETWISANFQGLRGTASGVIVVPPGTYRVAGVVQDEGTRVQAATVVIEDEARGRTEVKTINGEYKVLGVAGLTRITATKDGYEPTVRDQRITSHQTIDLELRPSRPRGDLSGEYTVTFIAAPECTALPEDVRVRTYRGSAKQSGPALEVTLTGARFLSKNGRTRDGFRATVEALFLRVTLTSTYFDYYGYFGEFPDVVEQLSDERFLVIEGFALVPISAGGLAAPFSGVFGVHRSADNRALVRCVSTNHRLTLERSTHE